MILYIPKMAFFIDFRSFLALYQGYGEKSYMRPQINLPKNTLGMISDHYQSSLANITRIHPGIYKTLEKCAPLN